MEPENGGSRSVWSLGQACSLLERDIPSHGIHDSVRDQHVRGCFWHGGRRSAEIRRSLQAGFERKCTTGHAGSALYPLRSTEMYVSQGFMLPRLDQRIQGVIGASACIYTPVRSNDSTANGLLNHLLSLLGRETLTTTQKRKSAASRL